MRIQCPDCGEVREVPAASDWLEVRAEIAWVDSSGCSPSAFTTEGCCLPCARKLFNDLANLVRDAVGDPTKPLGEEKILQRAEFTP